MDEDLRCWPDREALRNGFNGSIVALVLSYPGGAGTGVGFGALLVFLAGELDGVKVCMNVGGTVNDCLPFASLTIPIMTTIKMIAITPNIIHQALPVSGTIIAEGRR